MRLDIAWLIRFSFCLLKTTNKIVIACLNFSYLGKFFIQNFAFLPCLTNIYTFILHAINIDIVGADLAILNICNSHKAFATINKAIHVILGSSMKLLD